MSNWKTVKLGDLFDFKNGLNKGVEYFGHGTPIINYMDVNKRSYVTRDSIKGLVEVTKSEAQNCSARMGDVFFTRTSETLDEIGLSSVLVDEIEGCVFSGYVLRARPKSKELLPKYCAYSLRVPTIRKEIMRKSSMTTRALTNGRFLSDVDFVYPDLDNQKRIIAVLETWDEYLEKLNKKIELKKYVKKGLMQQLLTGNVRVKNDSKAWSEVMIKDVASVVSGATPDTTKSEYWDGDINWITPTEITRIKNGRITEKTDRKITQEGLQSCAASLIPTNSLILCSRATVGACAINDFPIATNQGFKNLIPNDNILVKFLYYKILENKKKLLRFSSGSTFLEFSKTDIQNMVIKLPELDEQKAVVDILANADNEIEELEKKKKLLESQKKYLTNNLISGKIRTPENLTMRTAEAIYA